jgi:beta-lactamase regulating signal transducer with metallopeptidase domain
LAWVLIHFLWQGVAIALTLVFVVRCLQIERPAPRYLLSLTAFALMAAAPLAAWFTLGPSEQPTSITSIASHERLGSEPMLGGAADQFDADHAPAVLSPWEYGRIAAPWLVLGWLAGVVLLSGRLTLGMIGVARLRRSRCPLPPEKLPGVAKLCWRLGMSARTRIYLSNRVGEAMCVGFFQPVVLLPACWVTQLPPAMLRAVIAHELAHIRRFDLWVNFAQRVFETLLFYHPAVWWLSDRLRMERELCCDQLAVRATGQRTVYASMLEFVARLRLSGDAPPSLAAAVGGNKMRLLNRVRDVFNADQPAAARWWPAGLMALAIALGGWLTADAWLPAAVAADGEKENVERERGDREEGDRDRPREGDRERAEPRDGDRERGERERPRAGDRERGDVEREGPRDGDRQRGEREEVRRDGDRPRGERELRRDGDREREVRRDGDRPRGEREGDFTPRERELMRTIAVLKAELEALRRELGRRGGEGERERERRAEPRRGDGEREEGERHIRRDGDREGGARREAREGDRDGGESRERAARRDGDREEGEREGRRHLRHDILCHVGRLLLPKNHRPQQAAIALLDRRSLLGCAVDCRRRGFHKLDSLHQRLRQTVYGSAFISGDSHLLRRRLAPRQYDRHVGVAVAWDHLASVHPARLDRRGSILC